MVSEKYRLGSYRAREKRGEILGRIVTAIVVVAVLVSAYMLIMCLGG